nr:hypothetical protein CFP56_07951 [Quercus suber]
MSRDSRTEVGCRRGRRFDISLRWLLARIVGRREFVSAPVQDNLQCGWSRACQVPLLRAEAKKPYSKLLYGMATTAQSGPPIKYSRFTPRRASSRRTPPLFHL